MLPAHRGVNYSEVGVPKELIPSQFIILKIHLEKLQVQFKEHVRTKLISASINKLFKHAKVLPEQTVLLISVRWYQHYTPSSSQEASVLNLHQKDNQHMLVLYKNATKNVNRLLQLHA
jgi:hypothetical protein